MSEATRVRAVERLGRLDARYKAADAKAKAAYLSRLEAVQHARDEGVTLRVCAETLGCTVEAITKMLAKARRDAEAANVQQP